MSTQTIEKMATGAQANFILTLQGMPKDDENRAEAALAIVEMLTIKEASALITSLKAEQAAVKVTVTLPTFKVAKGQWHTLDGKFYRVAQSQSTGKLYAKERIPGEGFTFGKGTIYKLGESTLINASHTPAISAYGHTFERCVFCNLPLDQPESITAGYGKKCSENNSLPWV